VDLQAELERSRREKDVAFRTDPHSPIPAEKRPSFKGLAYYPVDAKYRFEAALVREEPKVLEIQRSGGDVVQYRRLGHFKLKLPAGEAKLALYESKGHAFIPFRDATSGKETYGAGRYLDPPKLPDGKYLIDFNEAYNPFCAYNEAYSCPFPPPENWLKIPVQAGEKDYTST
jgi:uncharacterized protein